MRQQLISILKVVGVILLGSFILGGLLTFGARYIRYRDDATPKYFEIGDNLTVKGNVGIGTTEEPNSKLHVREVGGSGYTFIAADTAGNYIASIEPGKVLLARDGGDVGIGTIYPAFELDVNGIVNANAIYVNGSPCRICFRYAADGVAGQCNSGPWDGTSYGSGVVCAAIDAWTPRYRDDSDGRNGGCRLSWKIDCTPPYGD
jgi:hypothetical protein